MHSLCAEPRPSSVSHSPLTAAKSQRKQERPEQLGVGTDILFWRRSPVLPHLTLLLFISFYRFSPLSPCRTLCGINSLAELRSIPQGFCSSVDYLGRQNPRELCVGMVTRRMRTALRWSVGLFVWFVSSCNSGWVTVISSNPESFSAAGFLMTYFIVSCSSAWDQTICKKPPSTEEKVVVWVESLHVLVPICCCAVVFHVLSDNRWISRTEERDWLVRKLWMNTMASLGHGTDL